MTTLSQPAMKVNASLSSRPLFKPRIYFANINVSKIYSTFHRYRSDKFLGAACDTGAQKTVTGNDQAQSYCNLVNMPFQPSPTNSVFVFGDRVSHSIGTLNFILPTPTGPKTITAHIVNISIPFLLGLDTLDRHGWNVLTVQNKLESVKDGWTMPLYRLRGHVFLRWPETFVNLFTRNELERMHLHFMHPSASKMFQLLHRAYPNKLQGDTLDILSDISKSCDVCQKYSLKPFTFTVRFPDDAVFNQRIAMDLMYLDGSPVLHVIDTGTNFSAAQFLSNSDTRTIWDTFITIWVNTYTGYPSHIHIDQGSSFNSAEWIELCRDASVKTTTTGTESHNSLGQGETYHAMLRRLYNKIRATTPNISKAMSLSTAIKVMNDTAGPNGLVPSLLLFGEMPRIPHVPQTSISPSDRHRAIHAARKEFEVITAKSRVQTALTHKPPVAHKFRFAPGHAVYVYREKEKCWTGPHLVRSCDEKSVFVDLGERTGARQFNLARVKPAKLPSISSLLSKPPPLSEQNRQISRAELRRQHNSPLTFFTETIFPHDPRSKLFDEAKIKEIKGLIDRGTFQIILRRDAGEDPNIIPSRFVLAIKHKKNGQDIFRARFVVGGHKDRDNGHIVHSATNLKQTSIRLLLALASIFGFELYSLDVTQAYLQSASQLRRKIFIKPDILNMDSDELLQLMKPIYGLTDSGDYWHETFRNHQERDLEMNKTIGDSSLFFKRISNRLVGLSGSYVDDILRAGTPSFLSDSMKITSSKFNTKEPEKTPLEFTGLLISGDSNKRKTSHERYIERLEYLPESATYEDIRSARAKLSWVCNTRPDICAAVSILSQVTDKTFENTTYKLVNKVIKHLKATPNLGLVFPKLDIASVYLLVYSDAATNSGSDYKCQLGYIILLMDAYNRCSILQFSSHKSRRVTRSSLAGETIALADAFDNVFLLQHDLQRILGKQIPILMMTDSKLLFDVITGNKYTTEARLMVDIAAVREAYNQRTISNIALIERAYNIADPLTKITHSNILQNIMETGYLRHPISQYVLDSQLKLCETNFRVVK